MFTAYASAYLLILPLPYRCAIVEVFNGPKSSGQGYRLRFGDHDDVGQVNEMRTKDVEDAVVHLVVSCVVTSEREAHDARLVLLPRTGRF